MTDSRALFYLFPYKTNDNHSTLGIGANKKENNVKKNISIDKIGEAFSDQSYQEIARPNRQMIPPIEVRALIPESNNHTIKITPIQGEEYNV